MKSSIIAAFIVLGGCTGGGGRISVDGGEGAVDIVDVDVDQSEARRITIRITPPQVVAFVGDRDELRAASNEGPLGDSARWRSSDERVAVVEPGGVVRSVGRGSTTITVSLGNSSASASIRVTGEPGSLDDLLVHFPFFHQSGRARVYSDISPEFSGQHGDHLGAVYDYFARLLARSYGNASVAYYTQDQRLYERIFAYCPSVVIAGGRAVTGCYDGATGIQSLMIIPFQIPDFGTQLHEFSHQFLYATWPQSEDHPWIKEGTGMYWESGAMDASGELVVRTPLPYLRDGFRRFQGSLLPLERLLKMSRSEFYGHAQPVQVYSQSGMFVFYMMQTHPAVMRSVFAALNDRTVANNDQLLALIVKLTGLTLAKLDEDYVAHALSL